ncbi:APC family permease [bacterium]|nr:APC family permease [bacterium]
MVHERLPKWKALAVFSSDALSSVAYATQEILIPLSLFSVAAMSWSIPIALCITALLIAVSTSYWQTIRSYPNGGGAYLVVMDNLGVRPALVTAAALLIDYVLTVSVSVAAGVEAITSAVPVLYEHRLTLGCIAIGIVTMINLRGVRESGTVFALPTYLFIFSFVLLIGVGLFKLLTGSLQPQATLVGTAYPALPVFLILRAFASGCAALTGIEAISNGVPAFRKPESKNAQITLLWMALILSAFFLGITALSHYLLIHPSETETVISLLARQILGDGALYYLVQLSTALILLLAANTSFADFPRVCSLLAKDRFLPRQLSSLGDRLVFSNGIFLLGLVSALLLIVFQGTTHYLIPLYAIGVFLSFTMSQSGMVKHHWKLREPGWKVSLALNALGGVTTAVVLLVIAVTKFSHGAWVVIVLIPLLSLWFRGTREHYRKVAAQLVITDRVDLLKPLKHVVVLPISGIHRGVVDAVQYARSIATDIRVVHVELEEESTARVKHSWDKLNSGLELTILKSPYRSVVQPILEYIRKVDGESGDDLLTVVIPEFVTARWWQTLFHNQTALIIRTALLFQRGKVVTSVRYHLSR